MNSKNCHSAAEGGPSAQPLKFDGFSLFGEGGHFAAEGSRFFYFQSSLLEALGIRKGHNWAFGWRGGPTRAAVKIHTFDVINRKGRFRLDETLIC